MEKTPIQTKMKHGKNRTGDTDFSGNATLKKTTFSLSHGVAIHH